MRTVQRQPSLALLPGSFESEPAQALTQLPRILDRIAVRQNVCGANDFRIEKDVPRKDTEIVLEMSPGMTPEILAKMVPKCTSK